MAARESEKSEFDQKHQLKRKEGTDGLEIEEIRIYKLFETIIITGKRIDIAILNGTV